MTLQQKQLLIIDILDLTITEQTELETFLNKKNIKHFTNKQYMKI